MFVIHKKRKMWTQKIFIVTSILKLENKNSLKIMTQVKYLNMKKLVLEKIQCILQLNYF
jgi:hypothetical protein